MELFKKITFKEAQKRLKHRKDVTLIEKNYNGWTLKSEFYDLIQKEYFWVTPKYVCNSECCHPKRRKVLECQRKTLTFEEVKQKFVEQGRTDIILCKEGFNGWKKKSKFWDNIEQEYFYALTIRVYKNKSCHPKRSIKNRAKKRSLPFEEAQKRFENRKNIKLIEENYHSWKSKAKFLDIEKQDHFWSRPCDVFKDNSCHPKRAVKNKAKARCVPIVEAQQRFVEQGRDDIKLCEEGYNGFCNKAKFWDEIEQDYFWSIPYDVLKDNCCHPKRSLRNRTKKRTLPFKEATQRFIDQGRTDIELIENGYKGWRVKSEFYDLIQKEYFWAVPDRVFNRKSCHPKRKCISKAQMELFQYIKTEFTDLEIRSECTKTIKNKRYRIDIFIPAKNIIIEYNGDYWHCNPIKYKKDYYNKRSQKFAEEIWEYDKNRKKELESIGYKVFVVWEYDYNHNKKETLNKLRAIIKKEPHKPFL